jgi:hypothetical protein
MELQSLINENPDNYLDLIKGEKVNIRRYSQLGLIILKCNRNTEYNYDENKWLRYCRGAIIDYKNKRVVCIPPLKADDVTDLYSLLNRANCEVETGIDRLYQPLIDGTMINMFYHNDEWMISTRSNIGAKNSWDGKVPFHEMFKEIHGCEWFNQLNKDNCYSFILRHKKNRIVSEIENNGICLVESHNMKENICLAELPEIENIVNIFAIPVEQLVAYSNSELYYGIKGFTIKYGMMRENWINPNYVYVEGLKMNHNHKFLNYIELRQKKKLTEYLNYFPEDRHIYDEYRGKYEHVKQTLYSDYVSVNIKKAKQIGDVNYALKPLMYALHRQYKETNEKITLKVVSDYMHSLPGKKILFILKYFD